tara:strand:+ start:477 stop:674 length:198 start_codon:yes stop_codon:yes gene_type:complete
MQNIIDVSNHVLKYSQVYLMDEPAGESVQEEALQLLLKHGEYVLSFLEIYLAVCKEELNNEHNRS